MRSVHTAVQRAERQTEDVSHLAPAGGIRRAPAGWWTLLLAEMRLCGTCRLVKDLKSVDRKKTPWVIAVEHHPW